ncbi:MAG: pyridoxal phosphate-dependent aminotransferase family protein, partial [Clostridia bacterium]|nr:pyridoxal phosphate-dependent aminotransferase family protein [Clostridia bacterium]
MGLFQKCADFTIVEEFKSQGIYPYFHQLESKQDTEVIMEGKRRIMLGSNNYLGLTVHPEVVEAAVKATEKYGSGCSGSRFLNGTLDLHIQLEEELADFVGKEAALIFSTGFQTNLGIISGLIGRHDYMLSDIENHASIYDGCKLSYGEMIRFRHSDMKDLERRLAKLPHDAGKLIITDGVFSMSGEI